MPPTQPRNLYFYSRFGKFRPAGSVKQKINLVWPKASGLIIMIIVLNLDELSSVQVIVLSICTFVKLPSNMHVQFHVIFHTMIVHSFIYHSIAYQGWGWGWLEFVPLLYFSVHWLLCLRQFIISFQFILNGKGIPVTVLEHQKMSPSTGNEAHESVVIL